MISNDFIDETAQSGKSIGYFYKTKIKHVDRIAVQ